ncbi:GntP family permease [Niabella beijingensis]|uniref:GntP family permease n=1 Tax=Niabella beijingensis TaxID=2872700 RepID=UPI001CC196EB|nr:GntP family permease [Niabella beijingensis]MBZ4190859.1 GntP family permease [Niabella beijingensis]
MHATSAFLLLLAILSGIGLIIILSTKYKVHPFFSLSAACFVTGAVGGLDAMMILTTMKEGFGKIMSSLGFIIAIGTVLGMVLQANGATTAMANAIIKWVGSRRSVFAISLTGFIVGLPIFCDSGYIVLNGLNQSMIRKTAVPVAVMSTAMATGLYAVHCFIPPHPGVTAAVGALNADPGRVILYGLLAAVPAMLAGYYWAVWRGRKFPAGPAADNEPLISEEPAQLPAALLSFVPVVVPVLLIALRAVVFSLMHTGNGTLEQVLIVGDPAIALSIGLVLALMIPSKWNKGQLHQLVQHGLEKAGGILVIIGAGGAFGMVIQALKLQDYLSGLEHINTLGLLFPFLVALVLKTAQGSSTVAILTAASIVLPFLPGLQLDSENGRVIAVLAMGAGSMAVSHVNDAYFWVITNFSGQELKPVLQVYSTATVCMAVVGLLFVYLLSLIIL